MTAVNCLPSAANHPLYPARFPPYTGGMQKRRFFPVIDKNSFSAAIQKIPLIVFVGFLLLFFYGILGTESCRAGWHACSLLLSLVFGIIGVVGLYLIRPWLRVREKIYAMALDLKLLDDRPEAKTDLTLTETAESVIASLSQLQDNAKAAKETVFNLQQSQTDLLDNLPDAVMVLDQDMRILRANRTALKILGADVLGRELAQVLRPPQLTEACVRSLSQRQESQAEFMLISPVERHFQALMKPLRGFDGGKAGKGSLLLTLHDITTIKRTEQMRADFVANVSHEMRTPLSSLIGFVETLLGPAKKDIEAQENFLRIMETQAKNMARLVDDLLSLSRIEIREHTEPQDAVEVEAVLNNLAIALNLQLMEKNMRLQIRAEENLPMAQGHDDEIFQLLQNLITNAIRYGHAGTPIVISAYFTRDVPASFGASRQGAVAVSIEDQGIGIAAQHIPRLTERFYRVDKARSREVGGTGLGLAIVKHIISRHRGALQIESQEGVGSKFTVFLPVYRNLALDQNAPASP